MVHGIAFTWVQVNLKTNCLDWHVKMVMKKPTSMFPPCIPPSKRLQEMDPAHGRFPDRQDHGFGINFPCCNGLLRRPKKCPWCSTTTTSHLVGSQSTELIDWIKIRSSHKTSGSPGKHRLMNISLARSLRNHLIAHQIGKVTFFNHLDIVNQEVTTRLKPSGDPKCPYNSIPASKSTNLGGMRCGNAIAKMSRPYFVRCLCVTSHATWKLGQMLTWIKAILGWFPILTMISFLPPP